MFCLYNTEALLLGDTVADAAVIGLADPLLSFLNKILQKLNERLLGRDLFAKALRRIWQLMEQVMSLSVCLFVWLYVWFSFAVLTYIVRRFCEFVFVFVCARAGNYLSVCRSVPVCAHHKGATQNHSQVAQGTIHSQHS